MPTALEHRPPKPAWAARHLPFLRRAARVSILVGTCLVALNQGDVLLAMLAHGATPAPALAWKIPLTYLVPFLVSWHASAAATSS
jgi:hypothetical protein